MNKNTYRVVVGVDGTEGGERALRWAVGEAAARGGAVQAVMAWTWDGPALSAPMSSHPAEVQAHAERALAAVVQAVAAEHPQVTIAAETGEGDASSVLTTTAAGADLLVLGSHGHGRLHHAVLGSVAEACVRSATCPVVVVPVQLGAVVAKPAEVATVS